MCTTLEFPVNIRGGREKRLLTKIHSVRTERWKVSSYYPISHHEHQYISDGHEIATTSIGQYQSWFMYMRVPEHGPCGRFGCSCPFRDSVLGGEAKAVSQAAHSSPVCALIKEKSIQLPGVCFLCTRISWRKISPGLVFWIGRSSSAPYLEPLKGNGLARRWIGHSPLPIQPRASGGRRSTLAGEHALCRRQASHSPPSPEDAPRQAEQMHANAIMLNVGHAAACRPLITRISLFLGHLHFCP